ncbi:MAG: MCE family protein [Gemmatimonadetes bacterium]|nr:MCE family protein [Gemmatimonadota bacterium]
MGRVAAVGAIAAAVVLVAIVLFGGGSSDKYELYATFQNAGQLVKGNLVQVGGAPAGSVSEIQLTDDGQARVKFSLNDRYVPLHQGTKAVIRQASQSGIANRYIDLQFPPQVENGRREIADNGEIGIDSTETAVDLDQLFNTLDKPTRKSLQRFLKGSARQYAGREEQANAGLYYLNPALSTSSRLFTELNRDQPTLERFLVDSSQLVGTLAERREDLTGLITNLNTTTRALGDEKVALASVIERLPPFMRRSNTTFVNLRLALDDVDPLVEASKPVAKKLRPFFVELRGFARNARPTVRDLSRTIRRPGADNDLIELLKTTTPLKRIAVDNGERNGRSRRGAFPEAAQALRDAAPLIGQGRPYTPDLVGWFDDFSTSGNLDAVGGFLRFQVYFNGLTVTPGGLLQPIAPQLSQSQAFKSNVNLNQYKRCPGAGEVPAPDGSNVFSEAEQKELDCEESARATKLK